VVAGQVLSRDCAPVKGALLDFWHADEHGEYDNRGYRYRGHQFTDADGRYRFVTVKPGAYPWGNHENAWRPAHIHFSIFGRLFTQRLVTQMYFPGDPLFPYDPIFNSVRDPRSRELLIARFDLGTTEEQWALGFRWDIVLGGGRRATPLEAA